jgi:hypothetical protein
MSMQEVTKLTSSGPRTPLSTAEDVCVVFLGSSDDDNDLMAFILLTTDIRAVPKREGVRTNLNSDALRLCVTCLWLFRGRAVRARTTCREKDWVGIETEGNGDGVEKT